MTSMILNPAQTQGNSSGSIFDEADWNKAFPGGWGGSARETKSNWLMNQQNEILGQGEAEAKRIGAEEENRGAEMERVIRDAMASANKPTMTDLDIRRAMTDKSDAQARATNQSMSLLRSQLGGAGEIGGGRAAGIASQVALAKAGQITDARRGLFLEAAKSKALDNARNFQNSLTLANAVNRPVSTINLDWIQQALGINATNQGVLAERSAAKDAAAAAKSAGLMNLGGSLGGALITALA